MYCTIMYMDPVSFDWDEGNREKNWIKHRVMMEECEQVFVNIPLLIIDDPGHSGREQRFAGFGRTNNGRLLLIIFTWRVGQIRIISARNQDKKERRQYEKTKK